MIARRRVDVNAMRRPGGIATQRANGTATADGVDHVVLFAVALPTIGVITSRAGEPWTMPTIGRIAPGVIARRSKPPELPDGTA